MVQNKLGLRIIVPEYPYVQFLGNSETERKVFCNIELWMRRLNYV